jgi:hypothetical protein
MEHFTQDEMLATGKSTKVSIGIPEKSSRLNSAFLTPEAGGSYRQRS